ncbi:hypothetical protein INR49_020518 [Caranx melampygus]|nr:hypothetical protein INR49_020518 [Caranx melampygus]
MSASLSCLFERLGREPSPMWVFSARLFLQSIDFVCVCVCVCVFKNQITALSDLSLSALLLLMLPFWLL